MVGVTMAIPTIDDVTEEMVWPSTQIQRIAEFATMQPFDVRRSRYAIPWCAVAQVDTADYVRELFLGTIMTLRDYVAPFEMTPAPSPRPWAWYGAPVVRPPRQPFLITLDESLEERRGSVSSEQLLADFLHGYLRQKERRRVRKRYGRRR